MTDPDALLTYYDDATGERTALTAAELGGWAAATSALLVHGCGLVPGSRAAIRLPPHWQTAAVLLGRGRPVSRCLSRAGPWRDSARLGRRSTSRSCPQRGPAACWRSRPWPGTGSCWAWRRTAARPPTCPAVTATTWPSYAR